MIEFLLYGFPVKITESMKDMMLIDLDPNLGNRQGKFVRTFFMNKFTFDYIVKQQEMSKENKRLRGVDNA